MVNHDLNPEQDHLFLEKSHFLAHPPGALMQKMSMALYPLELTS
jgi:hypothetical protein